MLRARKRVGFNVAGCYAVFSLGCGSGRFTSLPEAQAGVFTLDVPRYYAFMIALSLIAALLLLVANDESAYQATSFVSL